MDNQLAKNNIEIDGMDFIGELTERKAMFCSLVPQDDESRALLFNAMNNPGKRLKDCVNMVINIKDVFCEVVTIEKKNPDGSPVLNENGLPVTNECPRIVFIDDKGDSYQCVSIGVFSALKKIFMIYGQPSWDEPIPMEVKLINRGDRSMLTVNALPRK